MTIGPASGSSRRRVGTVTGRLVSRTVDLAPALVLALLGSALLARRQSLWYDELFTAEVGPVPFGELVRAVLSGEGTTSYLVGVPPSYNAPYYAAVHLWLLLTRLPANDIGLRLLSLLATVGAVVVLTAAVSRLAGRQVGLTAGLVAATNPFVVEYAVEARGYGLAMLATSITVLGLAHWLDGGRLWRYAAGATLAGLAHWFALPVVAGLALAALLLRRRQARGLLAVSAAAAVPTLLLVGLTQLNGLGDGAIGPIPNAGAAVPALAVKAWSAGSPLLIVATVLAVAAGMWQGVRGSAPDRRTAVIGACWVGVPLVAVTLAQLARPVFVPRYLLAALLGLSVLTALGIARLPGRSRVVAAGLLVIFSLVAVADVYGRRVREDARGVVALIAARQQPGEPVVAVDRRAALALEHYTEREHPRLLPDIFVPPDDPPAGAGTVWLVRESVRGRPLPSDDDAILIAQGLQITDTWVLPGTIMDLVVQRWA